MAEVSTKGLAHERRGRDVYEVIVEVMAELSMIARWCGQILCVRHLLDDDAAAWDEFATRENLAPFLDRQFLHLGGWANRPPPAAPR